MSLRTTYTGMPRTSMVCRSVVTLALCNLVDGIDHTIVFAKQRQCLWLSSIQHLPAALLGRADVPDALGLA